MSMINEFVEKLIGRLEEELKTAREMQTTQCIGHDGYGTPLQSKLGGEICALLKVKNIVNQLAEEYNNESVKGDLISRSALLKELHKIEFPSYKNYDLQDVFDMCEDKVEQAPITHNDGWIPCSERLPDTETEVIVLAKRKFKGGDFRHIITTAFYEDGTVLENDSIWHWDDLDGEWNEEEDCYIIPEGWWEYRHYNMDEVHNNAIDNEVVAWQPLPEPYKGE